MKKVGLMAVCLVFLFVSSGFAKESKGLNVIVTSGDAQTQMMAMALSMMTIKKGKEVKMVLCSKAGDLAVKGMKGEIIKPLNKSPEMMLKALIQKGATVKVCPLYLPNAAKDESVLIDGVTVAVPAEVAASLLDDEYQNLSY
ncbi:MAG: hypothetical protein CSB24_07030 [Deltaproteobacteria bacterium]|nr:MAG: hypothetical protein CSB24_07030 [Deltaproteobacteria bacterium]